MNSPSASTHAYAFLLDTYETEVLKTLAIWSGFADDTMSFRPAPKSRTVLEQMDHLRSSRKAAGWRKCWA